MSGASTTSYTDSVAASAAASNLYVAVKSTNGMDVVSLASGAKTANSGGANLKSPTSIAVTPDGTTAYLANSGASTVTPVTLSNDTAGTPVTVGSKPPVAIAITPSGATAWVADGTGNVVTPVTVATNTAGSSINVGFNATAIAIAPDGTTAWIAGQTSVIPINLSTSATGTKLTQSGTSFQSIAISPDGTTAYLVDSSGKKLWPLNVASSTWGSAITFSFTPQAVAISPDGTTAWVAGGTTIVPVTLSSGAVGSSVTVAGASFSGIAVTPNGCWVYAADSSANNQVVPVSTTSYSEGTPIKTDTSPQDIATASAPATYYYEVQATRNLWSSAATTPASMGFGQPAQSS